MLIFTVSYTLVRSSSENHKGEYIPSAWDNRHIINVTGFANLGKNWEIGMKWRFVGGAPYTPYDLDRSSLISAWNVQGQGYFDYQQYNLKAFRISSIGPSGR